MKKTWKVLALALASVFLLAGCGQAPEASDAAQQAYLEKVDPAYGYDLANRIAEIRSNKTLGYRTAGSPAEIETGDLLAQEMTAIGLQSVTRDEFTLDTWHFEKANLSYISGPTTCAVTLGGYQTQFTTNGPEAFQVVYAGQGTAADYEGLDVAGKLVLIDINQRENWWINYPAYEAKLHGAAGVLAAQDGGYAEIDPEALNAQDICGPADAPAFSISQKDASDLKAAIEAAGGELAVSLDAVSNVGFDGKSYNIVGTIPGRNPDQMILMSAHYDSYFDGFQDDNAAIGLMLGIAKALVDSGYQPEKTLVFCATAAEEWGVSNTRYDWSTGAYNQVFRVHPEWVGKVVADINFELPAYSLGYDSTQIRNSYELKSFIAGFLPTIPAVDGAFPNGAEIIVPTQTWSDDFSFSIAGIPSSVTALRGDFAQEYYHSQFDDKSTYDEAAFRYHHNMYGLLMLAYDQCAVSPLDFGTRLSAMEETVNTEAMAAYGVDAAPLLTAITEAKAAAAAAYEKVAAANADYMAAVSRGDTQDADRILTETAALYASTLEAFKFAEDSFVRLTWEDVSVFPHELPMTNLEAMSQSVTALEAGDPVTPLDELLYLVDNNWYAYDFSKATYDYFTDYVLDQPDERLMWGAGRLESYVNLFDVVKGLQAKAETEAPDLAPEIATLKAAVEDQKVILADLVEEEIANLQALAALLTGE